MERDEMIFVVGASMRMLVIGGNECTNISERIDGPRGGVNWAFF